MVSFVWFLIGIVAGMILDVAIVLLVIAVEGKRELKETERRYEGW